MTEIKDYGVVFETIVTKTAEYLIQNNIKAQVIGISGGIDSTVVAAICYEVSILTGIPLIGRSLPTTFNKKEETTSADLVGNAFCDDYKEVPISKLYWTFSEVLIGYERFAQTDLANGNIQARLRMIYLYNLASIHKGIVMDTDNLTENNLGYFTIHGDVGDFNPIGGLWKTEVFELAEFLAEKYSSQSRFFETDDIKEMDNSDYARYFAVVKSLKLKPTAGLGITNDDLEELGAESYEQVDNILKDILIWKELVSNPTFDNYMDDYKNSEVPFENTPIEVVVNIAKRHFASEFKRKHLPIKIISEIII